MYIGLHVKYSSSFLILMKLEFSRQISEKSPNIKFHENPSSGSRVVPCGQTDMTKLIVAFRNFVNAPKNVHSVPLSSVNSCFVLVLGCAHTVHVGNNSYLNLISNSKI